MFNRRIIFWDHLLVPSGTWADGPSFTSSWNRGFFCFNPYFDIGTNSGNPAPLSQNYRRSRDTPNEYIFWAIYRFYCQQSCSGISGNWGVIDIRIDKTTMALSVNSQIDQSWLKSSRPYVDDFNFKMYDDTANPDSIIIATYNRDEYPTNSNTRSTYAGKRTISKSTGVVTLNQNTVYSGNVPIEDTWLITPTMVETADREIPNSVDGKIYQIHLFNIIRPGTSANIRSHVYFKHT